MFPGVVGWITQLVVDLNRRKRHIATQLLQTLKDHALFRNVTIVGLASSHPAACNALTNCARECLFIQFKLPTSLTHHLVQDVKIDGIDTKFICDNAKKILEASPVGYLKSAKLRGSLFQDDHNSGVISSVDTQFYVDHKEPLEALEVYKGEGRWCLGELLDGHEFLVVSQV
jgi:hypothetical protein